LAIMEAPIAPAQSATVHDVVRPTDPC
jgi:hypothetical protein